MLTHQCRGRALTLQALLSSFLSYLVEHLDQHREANSCVQMSFGNMEAKALCREAETNHHQEAYSQQPSPEADRHFR